MKEEEKKKAHSQFSAYTKNASADDINKISDQLGGMNKGALKKIWGTVNKLWRLSKDPNAAWTAKATAIGALIYVISPIDAVPDVLPIVGLMDDAGVVATAVASLGSALNKYE